MDDVDKIGTFLEHQGFSDDAIDDFFLEHFGKKGMKWGVRRKQARLDKKFAKLTGQQNLLNQRSSSVKETKVLKTGISSSPRGKRNVKILKGVAGVAAVSAGAYFATKLITSRGSTPIRGFQYSQAWHARDQVLQMLGS